MERNLNTSTESQTVLITGSSSGIGLHLAKEFAEHGHPLVLVAPESGELESVADALRGSHQVSVTTIARDLRDDNAALTIFEQLDGRSIEILVNNAGHGQKGKAWEISLEDDLSMVALNILAILRLTKLFLPPMVAQGAGRILNTACNGHFALLAPRMMILQPSWLMPGDICPVREAILSWLATSQPSGGNNSFSIGKAAGSYELTTVTWIVAL